LLFSTHQQRSQARKWSSCEGKKIALSRLPDKNDRAIIRRANAMLKRNPCRLPMPIQRWFGLCKARSYQDTLEEKKRDAVVKQVI
jgi:hypothetical protein